MSVQNSSRCRDHRDLQVFQRSRELAVEIIKVTERFPKGELHNSVSQMRRAAFSIASNIAEGYRKCSKKEYLRFLKIAFGSCGELDAQILISRDVGWISEADFGRIEPKAREVSRWLWRLIEAVEAIPE
jgi:four helix bundle protein